MRPITVVAIAGAGTMGASMAESFAKYGYTVSVFDIAESAIEKARGLIALHLETEVAEGLQSPEGARSLLERITFTTDAAVFSAADLVVEAIIENFAAKCALWTKVDELARPDALFATNTSGLSITKLAACVSAPERFCGMHWVNPPHIIPLVEVIKGEKTSDATALAIRDLCDGIGKKPVIVKDAPGFVLNRIQLAILRECLHIVDQGIASPEDVDNIMKYALGLRYACLGPFEVADHGGLDVFHSIASYLFADLSDERESFSLLKEAVARGDLGVKTGRGIYDYSDGRDKEAIRYRDQMYTKVARCLFGSGERENSK